MLPTGASMHAARRVAFAKGLLGFPAFASSRPACRAAEVSSVVNPLVGAGSWGELCWRVFLLAVRKEWLGDLGRLLLHLLWHLYRFLVERLSDLGRPLLHLLGHLRELLRLTMRVVVAVRHRISFPGCAFRRYGGYGLHTAARKV